MTDEKPTVYEALRAVSADVEAITKDRTAKAGGTYQYRGIEDVLSALHPLLVKHGVLVVPSVLDGSSELRSIVDKDGSVRRQEYEAVMTVSYQIIGPRGDCLHASMFTTSV